MDYQLVIKFRRRTADDATLVAAMQDEMTLALGDAAVLDGYDIDAREINLFVITPDPKHSFRRLKAVLEGRDALQGVSAAFRLVGGARFTSLWPLRSTRTFRLP
jgi:hypothetical protein